MGQVPSPLEKLRGDMQPAIQHALQAAVEAASAHTTESLQYMLSYQLGWVGDGAGPGAQGKQIRPMLVLLGAAASGGAWRQALPAAAAVELLHNFSLIHDDIQDNSSTRRGRPTVWKRWGKAQAINAGDAMFSLAHQALLDLELTLTPEVTLRACRVFQETSLHLTRGQHLDLDFEDRKEVTLDEYWQMVRGKTAALLGSAMSLGAICAQASQERQRAFQEFGLHLGLAFQAQDDILGIWGKTQVLGKSTESDLLSGKKTLPILYGLSQTGEFYRRWHAGPITEKDIPDLARLLDREGARKFARQQADRLTDQSLTALERAQPQGKAGQALHELALTLLGRED